MRLLLKSCFAWWFMMFSFYSLTPENTEFVNALEDFKYNIEDINCTAGVEDIFDIEVYIKEYSFDSVGYTTSRLNVREKPSMDSDVIEILEFNTEIKYDSYNEDWAVIKHNDTATVIMSGYDKNATRFAANYFLHYSLINYYKDKNFDYLDLNGVVGDFTAKNPYTGLNRFKLGFKPHIYEYIGEFDLIIESESYNILLEYNIISKEFNRTDLKKTEKELNEIKQNKSKFFKKKEKTYYSK